jgi:hypothetical protein
MQMDDMMTSLRADRSIQFTPEALADMRRRIEADEPRHRIAADYGISVMTLYRLAERNQWRRDQPLRDVPAARKLAIAAEEAAHIEAGAMTETGPASPRYRTDDLAQLPLVDRLQRAVETELSALELFQQRPGTHALTPAESERVTRILEKLIAMLSKIEQLRASVAPNNGPGFYDDIPEDIDEFRNELARRIEAFVKSRTEEEEAAAPAASGEPDPARAEREE